MEQRVMICPGQEDSPEDYAEDKTWEYWNDNEDSYEDPWDSYEYD